MSQCINYIREHGLNTVTDLEVRAKTQQEKLDSKTEICKNLESCLKEISELLRQAQNYVDTKPIYDEWYNIKFKGRKEKYKAEHDTKLRKYYAAQRKLKEHFKDGKLPISKWQNEVKSLKAEYEQERTELEKIRHDVQNLRQITVMTKYASIDNHKTERNKEQLRNHDRSTNSK